MKRFADDTQLVKSGQIASLQQMMLSTQDCISDLKSWMTQSKLKLNEENTEVLPVIPSKFKNHPSLLSDSICFTSTNIAISPLVHSLGSTLDQTLTFRQQISAKQLVSNHEESVQSASISLLMRQKRLCVLLLCNGLFSATVFSPKYLLKKIQKIQNNAARVVFRSSKHEHVTASLHMLHWLPNCLRIN